MKRSMRIGIMAAAICVIVGAWAMIFWKAMIKKKDAAQAAVTQSAAAQAEPAIALASVSAGNTRGTRATTQSGAGTTADAAIETGVSAKAGATASAVSGTPLFNKSELFTDRDLKQEADLTDAVTYTVTDEQDITITAAGVYVLTGTAEDVTVFVEADKKDKVQLVLDGLTITNDDAPVIYAKTADKLFVTTSGDSRLSVTGTFQSDGDTNTDGVIFSKCDLVLSGTAPLTVSSTRNGIVGKDDLKITGGTYAVSATVKAIEANDSIRVADGTLQLAAGTDGLHAENNDDSSKGYIYIGGGTLSISTGDDGIHATSAVQVDDGSITVTAAEGIEGTYVQLNGGTLSIDSRDDGINAAQKSNAYRATVEINGGDITIRMSSGDTDGVDSNGDIIVNGGVINVTGNSTFDCDGSAQYNGGTIIANGQQIDYIPNQMFGGRGGRGGQGGTGGWGRGGRGHG